MCSRVSHLTNNETSNLVDAGGHKQPAIAGAFNAELVGLRVTLPNQILSAGEHRDLNPILARHKNLPKSPKN